MRHAVFRAAAPDFRVMETYQVSTFAYALREGDAPDLIALDHDLQSSVNAGRHCNECGCDAAELVADIGPAGVPVLIHSANTPSAQRMRRILLASGRAGKVARMNLATVLALGDLGGVEALGETIRQLIASPHWPEDVPPEELAELLGDNASASCPVRAASRSGDQ